MKDDDTSREDVIVHANEMRELRVNDNAIRTGASTQAPDGQIGILNQAPKMKSLNEATEINSQKTKNNSVNKTDDKPYLQHREHMPQEPWQQ